MSPVVSPLSTATYAPEDILLLVFYVLLIFYALFTATLYYHWQTYSADGRINFLTLVIYFATTVPLIMTMAAVVALI